MGSSQQSIYTGRMRHGYGQYFMGTGFLYILASAIKKIPEKPFFVGAMAMLWGWIKSALQGNPRYEDSEFRKFLRAYQWRALLMGKQRAIEKINRLNKITFADLP